MFDLNFPRAYSALQASADFRAQPEDFFVDEQLGFDLSGAGEHLCLHIEKRGQNTVWVAKHLAEWAGIKQMDVGYCGLKDRQAVTRQWFSLHLPKSELTPESLNIEGCTILSFTRHEKKLRPGMHTANHFDIRLRNVDGEREPLSERFADIAQRGVPNYFGEQRFGFDGSNLQRAEEMLDVHARVWRERKNQFVVSAVRAYLFNQVLAERIRQDNWRVLLEGEPLDYASAPLWGRGRLSSQGVSQTLEMAVLESFAVWRDKLEHLGLQQERRALLLLPAAASATWDSDDLLLSFQLPPGTYATAILRELVSLRRVAVV
jgi:tRNA pseudouridine13 synthase